MAKKTSFKNSIVLTNSPGYAEYLLNQMMLSRNPNSEKNETKIRKTSVYAVQNSIHTDQINYNYGMFKTVL